MADLVVTYSGGGVREAEEIFSLQLLNILEKSTQGVKPPPSPQLNSFTVAPVGCWYDWVTKSTISHFQFSHQIHTHISKDVNITLGKSFIDNVHTWIKLPAQHLLRLKYLRTLSLTMKHTVSLLCCFYVVLASDEIFAWDPWMHNRDSWKGILENTLDSWFLLYLIFIALSNECKNCIQEYHLNF